MAKPEKGIALVFGPPMKKGKPKYGADDDDADDDAPSSDYEELARMAFPGLDPEDIDPEALKEFVMACMGK
jgi:hypothetical protein